MSMPIVLAKEDKDYQVDETVELCNSENLPIASIKIEVYIHLI